MLTGYYCCRAAAAAAAYILSCQACFNTDPVTVMVYDNCDGCETNQINLQVAPFSKLAKLDLGHIKIEYREVNG